MSVLPKIHLHEIVEIDYAEIAKIHMKHGGKGTELKHFEATSNQFKIENWKISFTFIELSGEYAY